MGPVCSKSNMAVAPIPFDSNEINIIWLGEKNVPCLSTLRREYGQVYVFDKLNDSIEMINSLPLPSGHCIYVIYDKFENKETSKSVINKINHLKQIRAIYIYYEDKNILHSYPSICTVSNDSHLATQIKMLANHLGALPIVDGSIANTIYFDGEDMRLEVHEKTFNALLNSVEELKFTRDNEQVTDDNGNIVKKDKRTNVIWSAKFVVSNMNISLKESDADESTNTVNVKFTGTVKATLTSCSLPAYLTYLEVNPDISITAVVTGDSVIMFHSEKNTFEIKALKAIVPNLDFFVIDFFIKNVDVTEWFPPYDLPGPVNLSQAVPIPSNYTTTTDGCKTTQVTIVDFKMRSQQKRIILSLKLNYQTSLNKAIT
jgi:hypothetical protein